jgi:hypothetical protein
MTKGQRDSIRPKHALAEGTLDLTTSKNQTAAVFDVTAYPLFTRALQLVPEAERRGPLVVDEDGPQSDADTTDLYRDIANAVGVPRAVWNMFARHGGVTAGAADTEEGRPLSAGDRR